MSNNIEKLLAVTVDPAQDLESSLQQLKLLRFVDTAEGIQLDIIGKLVGQAREGLSDDDYRRYIRARIAANNSNGTIEDLLTVAFLVIYDVDATLEVSNQGTAAVVMRVKDLAVSNALSDILIKFLGDTVSAGVRVITETCDQNPSTWFQWDTAGKGWDNGKLVDAKDNNGVQGS